MAVGAGILAGGAVLSSISGSKAAKKAAAAAARQFEQAMAMRREAAAKIAEIDPLKAEELRASIEREYENIPPEVAEQLGMGQMEQLQADPELMQAQMGSLAQMQQLGQEGVSPEEKALQEQQIRQVGAQNQSQQKAILQSMAERGAGGSGVELAARLGSQQGSAQQAQQVALQQAAENKRRAMDAIGASANMAGNISAQKLGLAQTKAGAADQIAQFNLQQRAGTQQRNIANARQLAGMKAGTTQQGYQNVMGKAQAEASAIGGTAQAAQDQAAMTAQSGAAANAAKQQLAGSLIGGAASMYGASQKPSDSRTKENISEGKPAVKDMLEKLSAYEYDYKRPDLHGEGKQISVMADDLQQSELGDSFVEPAMTEDENGEPAERNYIDYGKMAPTLLAGQAELNKENESLKSRIEKLEDLLNQLKG